MTALAPAPAVADRWPGLFDVPTGPKACVAAAIVRNLFGVATARLGVTVVVPNGRPLDPTATGTAPTIVLHRPDEFFRRIGSDGLIGFGEGYQTGAWSSPDLGHLLTVLASEVATLVPDWMQAMRRVYVARAPRIHRNTVGQTRGNIAHHYDLSNDLFRTFLDPTLSYSAALFDTRIEPRDGWSVAATPVGVTRADLEGAQVRKVERMLDLAGVGPGSRVLEIGTGWGELALRAAARGATVTSVTLSREQQALAEERIAGAGLSERVEVQLRDYREVNGSYDAVVSVEMIEAVGHEYWQTYLEKVDSLLVPRGKAAIQAITMPHDRMLATRGTYTWINKYIFPGGFLPSVEVLEQLSRDHTALRVTDRLSFGQHYAETLRLWDAEFRARHETVAALGFDEVFERMWHFYLEYSRGGFASAYIDVNQIAFTKEAAR